MPMLVVLCRALNGRMLDSTFGRNCCRDVHDPGHFHDRVLSQVRSLAVDSDTGSDELRPEISLCGINDVAVGRLADEGKVVVRVVLCKVLGTGSRGFFSDERGELHLHVQVEVSESISCTAISIAAMVPFVSQAPWP